MSKEVCASIVLALQKCGVNFLAIDFDMTLISEHTYGQWPGTAKELSVHVRPLFRTLLPLVLATEISVGIVTFSGQVNTISAVLRLVFPEIASRIVIRGEDRTWNINSTSRDGKIPHMASAAEELRTKTEKAITPSTTLLIDDDVNNIRIALENSIRAVPFDPKNIQKTIDSLLAAV